MKLNEFLNEIAGKNVGGYGHESARAAIGYMTKNKGDDSLSQSPYEKMRMKRKVTEYIEKLGAVLKGDSVELEGKKIPKEKFLAGLRTVIYSAERNKITKSKELKYITSNLGASIAKQK